MDPRETVVTPEAVRLVIDAAGLGSRMIALSIDSLIQGAMVLALTLAVAGLGNGSVVGVVYFAAVFAIVFGYFPLFEGFTGRTPGKRTQRLRVVRSDGQPAGVGPVLVRNIVRLFDFLPGFYAVGTVSILATRRSQRLGDLAAGTMVVRERSAPAPSPLGLPLEIRERFDTASVTQRDYVVVRDFLQRRGSFEPSARADLARSIASPLRVKVGDLGSLHDEAFLEAVAVSFRERFSGESGS